MWSRVTLAVYGVLWFACGMVIRVNPPTMGGLAGVVVAAIGWLIAVGGVLALITALSRSRLDIIRPRDGPTQRHRAVGRSHW